MKKMIAILVLCAFVSVSSAAIMFQAPTEVQAGETFTINLIADAATTTISINALALSGHAAFSGNAVNAALVNGLNNGLVAAANTGNVILTTIGGSMTGELSAGTVLFSIQVRAGDAGSVIVIDDYVGSRTAIGLVSGPNFATRWNTVSTPLEAFSVNVVPEPMTMALLGLGGLFIRRRRA